MYNEFIILLVLGTNILNKCLHFPPVHQTRLEELHRLWDLLLQRTKEKGMRLLQAQKLVQYLRECEDAMDWITDKVRLVFAKCYRKMAFEKYC